MPHTKWLNISKGRITWKDGEEKKSFPGFTGMWVGYDYRSGEEAKFGTELHLFITVGKQLFDLGMGLAKGYARSFMRTMENLDISKPITIYPKYKEDENGKYGWLVVFQDGKQVSAKYTSKDLNGCPDKEMIDDGAGKSVPNYSKQVTFLREIMETVMRPKLAVQAAMALGDVHSTAATNGGGVEEAPTQAAAPVQAAHPVQQAPPITDGDEDDLPF